MNKKDEIVMLLRAKLKQIEELIHKILKILKE